MLGTGRARLAEWNDQFILICHGLALQDRAAHLLVGMAHPTDLTLFDKSVVIGSICGNPRSISHGAFWKAVDCNSGRWAID